MASSKSGSGAMTLERMSVEQLKAVKEQADMEVNLLQDSLNNIGTATTRLELATTALNDLSLRSLGSKILVPLTASLYVPATLQDPHHVLVDIGTGYFVEVSSTLSPINLFRSVSYMLLFRVMEY
jgi:prefoldin alpha subunit